jgi:hypothetical protein
MCERCVQAHGRKAFGDPAGIQCSVAEARRLKGIRGEVLLHGAADALIGAGCGSAGERCVAISVAVPVGEQTAERLRARLTTNTKTPAATADQASTAASVAKVMTIWATATTASPPNRRAGSHMMSCAENYKAAPTGRA